MPTVKWTFCRPRGKVVINRLDHRRSEFLRRKTVAAAQNNGRNRRAFYTQLQAFLNRIDRCLRPGISIERNHTHSAYVRAFSRAAAAGGGGGGGATSSVNSCCLGRASVNISGTTSKSRQEQALQHSRRDHR